MATQSSAGTKLGISAAAPATYNLAGFAALAFTNVGEIKSLGEVAGKSFQLVTSQILDRRGEKKRKGTFNAGQASFTVELDNTDAGQTLMQQALDSDADYSFVVTLQNGDKYYRRGMVTKFTPNVGGPNDMVTASVTIEWQPFNNDLGAEVDGLIDPA